MAQTTYTIALTNPNLEEAMVGVIVHLRSWKQLFNIDLVSIVRVPPNVEITLSDAPPLAERQHIKLALI